MKDSSNSLRLLQRIVTITRFLAYQNTDPQKIASILDLTDGILNLLMYGEDEPGELEQAVKDLGRKAPEFGFLWEEYARPLAA